ncbi:MAG: glycosyl hydrolase [Actinomycetia bacterium]|nr:glycosyl hydrolase [Actinomycetes bacterium]
MTDLTRLSVQDKANLCSGRDMWHLEAVPALDLDAVMITDGPHGLRKQPEGGSFAGVAATCFPTATGLASSWDPDLLRDVGSAIAGECLAEEVAVLLGPGVNIKRHPLCGRNFEYFSEDPLLGGTLAAAFIQGVQSRGIGTSLKHFVANNQETRRMVIDTIVDERSLREIYLAGFEIAIREAQPWTVMCAYNKLNGTYCSDDPWLLTTVLRDEWGFEGIVVTDWGATNDRVEGVRAGLDLEMPGSGGINDALIVEAVEAGELAESALDEVAGRMLDLIARSNGGVAQAHTADFDANHELARRAAAESNVLLTNDGFLPLDPAASVALIGEFATVPRYQGAGSSMVEPTRLDTLLDGVRAQLGPTTSLAYAAGYEAATDALRPDLIDEAVMLARGAEVAIVIVGLPASYESEAYDRPHMRLPAQHNQLVRAVVDVNPNTVVVLSNGSVVQLPWIDAPRAVLDGFLGGQGGGEGTARVLYGQVNPSGKLAETFPLRQSDHGSDANFGDVGRQLQYREGVFVGYRWFDTVGLDVLFPFGHGLSYTDFGYGELRVQSSNDTDSEDFEVEVSVTITNEGSRTGAEVVQLYVRDVEAGVARPDRELKAFDKIRLEPGESQPVTLKLDRRAFAFWDDGWVVEAGDFEILVGASSRDIRSRATITVDSGRATSTPWSGAPSFEDLEDKAAFETSLGRPVPAPDPVRPFTRTSTISDVSKNPIGAGIRKVLLLAMPGRFGAKKEDLDDGLRATLEAIIDGMPLRSIALLSGGKISWTRLDKLIALMNRIQVRENTKSRFRR